MWIIAKELMKGQWYLAQYFDNGKPRWSRVRSEALAFDTTDRAHEVKRRLKTEGYLYASVIAR